MKLERRKEKVVGNISRRFNTEKRCRKEEVEVGKRGMDERQEERGIANGE